MKHNGSNPLSKMLMAVGGLAVLGLTIMFFRELPAMRREWRIMRM